MQSDETFNYTLDIPQKEGAAGYIGTFLTLYLKVASTMQNPQNTAMNIYYQIQWMISAIPDQDDAQKIRDAISLRKKELEQEYQKDGHTIDQKLRDHILLTATIEKAQMITQYVDKHIGISSENKIGWGVSKNREIVIKGSPLDLKIKELERQIEMKDTEIKILKGRLNDKK